MSDHAGYPGGLSEDETLTRLAVAEKRRVARGAIIERSHLDHETLDRWLHVHGADSVPAGASILEKTDALLDRYETLVRSGEELKALDRFVYGELSPASLEALGINPADVVKREPLDAWDCMYDGACPQ